MTTSTNIQTTPYLPKQRTFNQDDPKALGVEIDKAYVDIANRVNERTIGIFGLSANIVTGEQWFLKGSQQNQQTLRKLFKITSDGNFPHGLNLDEIDGFTRIYGTFTDGTLWYPLPYVDGALVTNQISLTIDATNVIVTSGATAPTITNGFIIIEWLSKL